MSAVERQLKEYKQREKIRRPLAELAYRALPVFRDLVNSAARFSTDSTAKRIRQLLEGEKFLIAVVDSRFKPALRLVTRQVDFEYSKGHYGVVVVNARKLINASNEDRHRHIDRLVGQFERYRSAMNPQDAFLTQRTHTWGSQAKEALRENGINPEKALLTIYG